MAHYAKDTPFTATGIAAPLTLIALFALFVYGALIVGLMGVSNTLIHAYGISFLAERGAFGAFLGMCAMLLAWICFVLILAAIPYSILRARGKDKRARLVGQVIIFLIFHVFTMPVILWVMIRNSSPRLRARHFARLRRIALARRKAE